MSFRIGLLHLDILNPSKRDERSELSFTLPELLSYSQSKSKIMVGLFQGDKSPHCNYVLKSHETTK